MDIIEAIKKKGVRENENDNRDKENKRQGCFRFKGRAFLFVLFFLLCFFLCALWRFPPFHLGEREEKKFKKKKQAFHNMQQQFFTGKNLTVTVVRGTDLVAKDHGGVSDPYVEIFLGQHQVGARKQTEEE